MSTVVTDILSAAKTQIETQLSSYSEMSFEINVEKNTYRGSDSKYAFYPGSSTEVDGVTTYYTMDHTFNLVLAKTIHDRKSDADLRLARNELYSNTTTLFSRFYTYKLGLPSQVLHVRDLDIAEAEFLDDNKVIVLRSSMIIRYRTLLNSF